MSKYAFITGATSGIGLATAKALAEAVMIWRWLQGTKGSFLL